MIINETGTTQTAAIAIFQLKKNKHIDIITVDITEPTSSGMKCENAVSKVVQSDIIVFVKSARSFLPKNDNGIFLNFSAKVILLTPDSTYVARNVALY